MNKLLDTYNALVFSFKLSLKHPFIFIPKLVIAVLYGYGLIVSVGLIQQMFVLMSDPSKAALVDLSSLLGSAVVLLLLTLGTFFFDIIFSGIYPTLVEQAISGKINFAKAILPVKKKIGKIIFAGILSAALVGIASGILSFILISLNFDEFSWIVSLAVGFAFIFLLYFLFPTIIFGKKGVKESFKLTLFESFSNKRIVVLYSVIPFSVSVIKFVIAFFISVPGFLILFWILVVVTGFIYTLHAVSNQVIYSNIYLHKMNSKTQTKKTSSAKKRCLK